MLVPIFDARREAVYAGVYQYQDNELITIIDDTYIPIFELIEKLHQLNQPYVFVGFHIEKIKHLLDSDIVEQLPQASSMKQLIQNQKIYIHLLLNIINYQRRNEIG